MFFEVCGGVLDLMYPVLHRIIGSIVHCLYIAHGIIHYKQNKHLLNDFVSGSENITMGNRQTFFMTKDM